MPELMARISKIKMIALQHNEILESGRGLNKCGFQAGNIWIVRLFD